MNINEYFIVKKSVYPRLCPSCRKEFCFDKEMARQHKRKCHGGVVRTKETVYNDKTLMCVFNNDVLKQERQRELYFENFENDYLK